jgi:ECF sigma factor
MCSCLKKDFWRGACLWPNRGQCDNLLRLRSTHPPRPEVTMESAATPNITQLPVEDRAHFFDGSAIVELRFFAGLSPEESAEVVHVSVSYGGRDWRMAQAWLHQHLSATP